MSRIPEITHHLGLAREGAGNTQAARELYERSAANLVRVGEARFARGRNYAPQDLHYQGRAFQKLGRGAEAVKAFQRLIEAGQASL